MMRVITLKNKLVALVIVMVNNNGDHECGNMIIIGGWNSL